MSEGLSPECGSGAHGTCPGYYKTTHPCRCGCHQTAAVVCAVGRCHQSPVADSGVLCQRHYDVVGQLVPDRLEKKPGHGTLVCDQLNKEELAAIAAQVERDAFPLFLVAWNWCGLQAIGKVARRGR